MKTLTLVDVHVSSELWEKKFDRGSSGRLAPADTTTVRVDTSGIVEEDVSRHAIDPPPRHIIGPLPER